jgi:hypothetical protein
MPEISYFPSGAAEEIKVDFRRYTTPKGQKRQMRILCGQRMQCMTLGSPQCLHDQTAYHGTAEENRRKILTDLLKEWHPTL